MCFWALNNADSPKCLRLFERTNIQTNIFRFNFILVFEQVVKAAVMGQIVPNVPLHYNAPTFNCQSQQYPQSLPNLNVTLT